MGDVRRSNYYDVGRLEVGETKTKFRKLQGRGEKGGGRRTGKQGLKEKVGECVTILFVTWGTTMM